MSQAEETGRAFRKWAINLMLVAAGCAGYIIYRYATAGSTTVLSWIVLSIVLIAAMHYFRLSRR